jgi:formylglycine-generating enzyme required for sulfatase activity
MGSNDGESDERPVHSVTIPRPFAVGKYEVTQAEWQAVMGSDPSYFKGPRNPVENVSWNDSQEFIRNLNAKTGKKYRLLTEAEWEYAARAGTATRYWCGDGADCLDGVAWFGRNSGNRTQPVGGKAANVFGLHDMHGNVWEWVEDCWNGSYAGAPSDGTAWLSGDCRLRVLRGGSWYVIPRSLRSAIRDRGTSVNRLNVVGFRVARTLN